MRQVAIVFKIARIAGRSPRHGKAKEEPLDAAPAALMFRALGSRK